MRCQNKNCMNVCRAPRKAESFRKFGMCRICCVKLHLIIPNKYEGAIYARKSRGLNWKAYHGYEYKQDHEKIIKYVIGDSQ